MSTCKKTKLDTDFKSFTKINLKWITSLNVKCKTINLLEDNVGESLDDFGYGDDFLDTSIKTWYIRKKIAKLYFIKI